MQIKKEEMRAKILECAEEEFLKKGYEASSMRIIAKKANTTLGNIYHYFPNKEAILSEILTPIVNKIETMLEDHLKYEMGVADPAGLAEQLNEMVRDFTKSEFSCFLDRKIVILLKLKESYFVEKKEKVLEQLRRHLRWHLGLKEEDSHYSEIILNMFVECVEHVLKEHSNVEDANAEFASFFKFMCTGMFGTMN